MKRMEVIRDACRPHNLEGRENLAELLHFSIMPCHVGYLRSYIAQFLCRTQQKLTTFVLKLEERHNSSDCITISVHLTNKTTVQQNGTKICEVIKTVNI
jgi:hypothetical protein